jgi:PPM family protein phosphatase
MGHWFVGVTETADGDEVAVFQGLDASVVGLDLYRLDQATGLATTDLTQAARSRVTGGINATDKDDAQRILANLRGQRLPACPTTPSTAASTSAAGAPTADTGAPLPSPADPAAPTLAPTTTPSAPASTGPTRSAEPGVDCREAD